MVPRNQSSTAAEPAASLRSLPKWSKLPGSKHGWISPSGQDVCTSTLWPSCGTSIANGRCNRCWKNFILSHLRGYPLPLFSHQIMPVGELLVESQPVCGKCIAESPDALEAWHQYVWRHHYSAWMGDYLTRERITDYGVPEFHPQQWKTESVHMTALQAQYDQGARLSALLFFAGSQRFKGNGFGINRLELGPKQPTRWLFIVLQSVDQIRQKMTTGSNPKAATHHGYESMPDLSPIGNWRAAQHISGVFTDIDDTLTTDGAITSDALEALASSRQLGCTWSPSLAGPWLERALCGQPGRWMPSWRRTVRWLCSHRPAKGLVKRYQQDETTRQRNYARMQEVLAQIEREGARRPPCHRLAGARQTSPSTTANSRTCPAGH